MFVYDLSIHKLMLIVTIVDEISANFYIYINITALYWKYYFVMFTKYDHIFVLFA